MREEIKLTEELSVVTFPYTDYISCVEVFKNGKSMTVFCSDRHYIDECRESEDSFMSLVNEFMKS
ncbi:hypothetical protein QA612_01815 [Evansella sp. AB-P1]|uniref:hypothetical protein n=1 Tax=Evansella sp. AB-P1 TaxID=3037653 RepID=UPI00241EA5D3|nr:hypothetical protein [Evansella sp. AB-P1]MDG5786210.1 hypothetical protein [Evansella sp. AB-P1]